MSEDYRVLVCGGRDYSDANTLVTVLDELKQETEINGKRLIIIHGAAKGADKLAESWAEFNKLPIKPFHANWKKHGRAAGSIRNTQMLEEGRPDLVLAFPGGPGTRNMVQQAIKYGVPVRRAV
jgi:hypothetical protein